MLILGEHVPLDRLRDAGNTEYWYVASPYTLYPGGKEAAFRDIMKAAVWLRRRNVPIFVPILHTHQMADEIRPEEDTHQFWLGMDEPMMWKARGLIIAMMPSWDTSYGVSVERMHFAAMGRPEYYLPWPLREDIV